MTVTGFMDDWFSEPPDPENESYTARVRRNRRARESALDRRVREVAERARREGHENEVTVRFVDPESLKGAGS